MLTPLPPPRRGWKRFQVVASTAEGKGKGLCAVPQIIENDTILVLKPVVLRIPQYA